MAKLYPPYIEGTIPAFYDTDEGTTIVVPFSMNKAVSLVEVRGLSLKVKKVNTDEVVATKDIKFEENFVLPSNNCEASFFIENYDFKIGQYYRVQLAYINSENEVGYYSTVAVIKCTGAPRVSISNLSYLQINPHSYDYTLSYIQDNDISEKLYSFNYILTDDDGAIEIQSDEIIHSVLNDTKPNEATEVFNIPQDLDLKKIYYLKANITTVNGLTISTPNYRIKQEDVNYKYDVLNELSLKAENNMDSGGCSLYFKPIDETNNTKEAFTGSFIVSRSVAKEPYRWETLAKIFSKNQKFRKIFYTDCTVEQGKHYVYAIQFYNLNGIISNRLISNEVIADFEDLFILDGTRQLKVKFNPKVSSFKENIQETRVNTIGSKYPFITRSGKVYYKEFPISGLISYQMDDQRQFMSWKDLEIEQNITDLITENLYAERTFKLEVMKWLNDGKPKLVRSPAEGNYLVRLMNTSLSPNDTLGRMLHTFSTTAVEIAPYDYETLKKLGFIKIEEPDRKVHKWQTIEFYNEATGVYLHGDIQLPPNTIGLKITGMFPGSIVYINNQKIYIGATGSYSIKLDTPIKSFSLPSEANGNYNYIGSMTIEFIDDFRTPFDDVLDLSIEKIPVYQYIGTQIINDETLTSIDILEDLQDIKTIILNIPWIRFSKREAHKIFAKNFDINKLSETTFYTDDLSVIPENNSTQISNLSILEPLSLYKIYHSAEGKDIIYTDEGIKYRDANDSENLIEPYTGYYYDPVRDKIIEDKYEIYDIKINGDTDTINLKDGEEKEYRNVDFHSIIIGDGILVEMCLINQILEYAQEKDNDIASLKNDYLTELNSGTQFTISEYLTKVRNKYKIFINALTEKINTEHK